MPGGTNTAHTPGPAGPRPPRPNTPTHAGSTTISGNAATLPCISAGENLKNLAAQQQPTMASVAKVNHRLYRAYPIRKPRPGRGRSAGWAHSPTGLPAARGLGSVTDTVDTTGGPTALGCETGTS